MNAKLEKIENSEAHIAIEVDTETMEEGFEHAYRKVVKQVAVPGFRKGRVPRELLEARFGKEILYQDALEYVVPDAYEKALDELEIKPIAQPDFDIQDIEDNKPFKFNVKVAVKPEVQLGDLEGLAVSIPNFEVTDNDVEKRLEDMRSSYAKLQDKVDEPAENGDKLTIDFEGFVNGEPFAGGKAEDYELELGSQTFIPGFEEQLVGVQAGETREVNVTFPEEYQAPELAGQEAVFKVAVKQVQTKVLRNLDDEFAQEISNFDTLAELREDIKKNLETMAGYRRKEMLREELLNKALQGCEIITPDSVIREAAQRMMQEFEQRLVTQGLNLEQYFKATNATEEEFIKEIWPEAERNVKKDFLLEKLVEEKGFEVTDEELDQRVEEVGKSMGMDLEQAKQNLTSIMDRIKFSIKVDKAIDYLIDHAQIAEGEQSAQEEPVESDEEKE